MQQTSETSRAAPLLSAFDSLLAATSAFKNLRAIGLMGLTLIAAILVGAVFSYLGSSTGMYSLIGLGTLLALLVGFYGISAVGILLMHEAQGQPSGTMMDAVLLSLFSSHRLLAVAILELLIVLVVGIVVAIVFMICKIPVIGPVLFTFALPISALVFGIVIFSLFYIMLPLAGPAVWSGSTAFQTIARLNMIARTRLIPVVIQQFVLFVILMFAAGIIFAIVGLGLASASGLSASIIGAGSAGFGGLTGMMYGMGGAGGHMLAGAIGGGVLFAVAAVIPALIATKGLCIIYLNAIAGMDFAQAEAQLESGVAAVKKKAEEARERARQLAEQQAQKARDAAAASAAAAAQSAAPSAPSADTAGAPVNEAAATNCPGCGVPVTPDDVFCGECGYKLK